MHQLIQEILNHNEEQSAYFTSPDARFSRAQYRVKHPTAVAALKCMDGRVHIPLMTKTPLGIIKPWRNLGGKFDMGWPHFGLEVSSWVEQEIQAGRDCLILVTYHFSAGDKERGCRGFNYYKEEAQRFTATLTKQVERVFGKHHEVVYPIQVGIETDEDALVLYGKNGGECNLAKERKALSDDYVREKLVHLYPDMKNRMVEDLLPLIQGNYAHIQEVRKSKRPVAKAEHQERVLGVGSGFDWLHTPNFALIVGPFSPNLGEPITTAARLLLSNIETGRIPSNGIVLLSSAPYREEAGSAPLLAREKALFLSHFVQDIIRADVPELWQAGVFTLTVTLNLNTRKLDVIESP